MKSIRLTVTASLIVSFTAAVIITFFIPSDTWAGKLISAGGILLILVSLIYFILQRSLAPLSSLSKDLSQRATSKLESVNFHQYPLELRGMLKELNLLFARVRNDYDRNKRFSADAAHELRTPLTALKTQAQLALEMTDPEERKRAIQNVLISVDRSVHVVQQLLTLSRLDHEAKLNDVMLINIETICAEMIAIMYPQALEKNIEIELHNDGTQSLIMGNDAALGILLRNLLDNAIRYTEPNGRVNVNIKKDKEFIILQVKDSGPGIPKEYQEKVFDRFFRVLGTKQTGSGLGLAIVKQITDLHKAKIHLHSENNEENDGGKTAQTGLTVTVIFRQPQPQIS